MGIHLAGANKTFSIIVSYSWNQRTLRANCTVKCISVNQEALLLTAAMGFQDVDRIDGVFGDSLAVYKLHSHGSIDHHVSKEVSITEKVELRSTKDDFHASIQSCIPYE